MLVLVARVMVMRAHSLGCLFDVSDESHGGQPSQSGSVPPPAFGSLRNPVTGGGLALDRMVNRWTDCRACTHALAHASLPATATAHPSQADTPHGRGRTQASPRRTQERCLESIVLLTAPRQLLSARRPAKPQRPPQRASTTPDPARYPYPMTTHPSLSLSCWRLGLDPTRAAPTERPAASIRMSVRMNGLELGVGASATVVWAGWAPQLHLGQSTSRSLVRGCERRAARPISRGRRGGRDGPLIG